jgi:phage-related protein
VALAGGPTVTLTFKGDADQLKREIASIGTVVAGVGGSVGVLGAVGAAASAVVVAAAAIPVAFLGIGIAAAAQSEAVKARFTEMKDHVVASVTALARPIEAELLRSANSIQAAYDRIAPSLGRIFEMAAPHLRIFTDGLIALVENAMPGFETTIRNATPLVESFSRGLGTLGTGIGGFFAALTEGTPGAVAGMDALFGLTRDLLVYLGQLTAQLANALGPAFARMAPVVMDLVRHLGDFLMPIIVKLAPLVGDLAELLGHVLGPAFDTLKAFLMPVIDALVDSLAPIIPVIKEAFDRLQPVMLEIAQKAGPLLAEIIRVLAPLFLALLQGAIDLTAALLPVIPPLLEMANNAMPLLKGVIQDVLIPVIQWLVREFVGLIDYGVKIAEGFADLSVRWRTYWDEIKAAFADANSKIRAGIEAFVSLPETARRHWDTMYQAIKAKIGEIVAEVAAFPGKLLDAILAPVKRFYEAGAGLMQSFADGISSKMEAAKAATANVLTSTGGMFPASPAKEGPFSGTGYTYYRGQTLIEDFGRGITEAAPRLADLARSALAGASVAIQGFTGQGGTARANIAGVGGVELKVAPGADSALASLLMNLVRTGQLQLARA